jgi:transposase-like protein
MNEFSTIEDYEEHFRLQREHEGIVCKRCKSEHHYWLKGKKQWQCKSCKFRTMLLSETVMEHLKLNLQMWYSAMALICFTKKGISCNELQRQLDLPRYESVLRMFHMIRTGMGKRDDMFGLKGMLELDEGCFKIETNGFEKSQIKAGRGSTDVQNELVVVELTPLEDANGNESKHCGYYNIKVMETHQSKDITQAVAVMIDPKCIVFSDKSTSYVDLKDIVEGHYTELSGTETTKSTKKWVYNAISNAKRVFNGIYQKISLKYIQLYLNEFCCKLNRRYFGVKLLNRKTLAMAKCIRYECEDSKKRLIEF